MEQTISEIETLLRNGISVYFRGAGHSMFPFLKNGDYLLVTPTTIEDIQKGDVVFSKISENCVQVHRVVEVLLIKSQYILVTKGDGLAKEDQPLGPQALLGRVQLIKRGKLIKRLDTTSARMTNYYLAILSYLIGNIYLWFYRLTGLKLAHHVRQFFIKLDQSIK